MVWFAFCHPISITEYNFVKVLNGVLKRQKPSVRQHADRKQEVMASIGARQLLLLLSVKWWMSERGREPALPLYWIKKKKPQKEEKPAGEAKRNHQTLPTPPSLKVWMHHYYVLQLFPNDVLFRKLGQLDASDKVQTILWALYLANTKPKLPVFSINN